MRLKVRTFSIKICRKKLPLLSKRGLQGLKAASAFTTAARTRVNIFYFPPLPYIRCKNHRVPNFWAQMSHRSIFTSFHLPKLLVIVTFQSALVPKYSIYLALQKEMTSLSDGVLSGIILSGIILSREGLRPRLMTLFILLAL